MAPKAWIASIAHFNATWAPPLHGKALATIIDVPATFPPRYGIMNKPYASARTLPKPTTGWAARFGPLRIGRRLGRLSRLRRNYSPTIRKSLFIWPIFFTNAGDLSERS